MLIEELKPICDEETRRLNQIKKTNKELQKFLINEDLE